jgi:hypothetical protein
MSAFTTVDVLMSSRIQTRILDSGRFALFLEGQVKSQNYKLERD